MSAVIPSVTKLSARIIRILGCNPSPMTLQGTSTYIIGTGKRRVLVDAGDADIPQYINHLKSVLKYEGINLDHIFITHWHHDHIGGISDVVALKEYTENCQVWKYPQEDRLNDLYPEINFKFLKDGQEFALEGATIRIIHTPGHSTDHIILHMLEENAIFSGDCILGEGTAVFEDLYNYMKSLEHILDLNPAIIYPAHGNVIHDPQERIKFYISHRNQREQQILNVLTTSPKKQFSAMDIVNEIYTDTPKHLHEAAASNIRHHISKLLRENRVKQIGSYFQYINTSSI